jgi:hypothetical protein
LSRKLRLQKHERAVLDDLRSVAQELGVQVRLEHGSGPKKVLVVVGPRGERHKRVSSSPRTEMAEVSANRTWLKRAAAEVA